MAFEKIKSVSFTRSITIHLSKKKFKSSREIKTLAPIIHGKNTVEKKCRIFQPRISLKVFSQVF